MSFKLGKEHVRRLRVFENSGLGRVFVPKRERRESEKIAWWVIILVKCYCDDWDKSRRMSWRRM